MSELLKSAARALEWVRGRGITGLEAEIYLARSQERSVERRDGHPDGVHEAKAEGVGLRVLCGGRMGFASAGGTSLETVQELFEQVLSELPFVEPDPLRGFPDPMTRELPADDAELAASLWDDSLFRLPWDQIVPRLVELESAVRGADARIKSVLRAGYSESQGEVVIANSAGLVAVERGGSASVGLSALAADGAELQVGSAFQSSRRRDALDLERVGRDAAQRTVALLGSVKVPGGRKSIVFDPWVSGEFLDLVSGLLCADEVQRGKSLLAGKLGQKIGSGLAQFLDDPRLKGGLASALFDDEGCRTVSKTMLEGGVVKDYFYDTYTAAKDRRASNASAGRGSYKGTPGPGCSNFYLAPGATTREALLSSTKDGLLVLEVMGMHMADPISGEFSVGVSGLEINGGALGRPVKNAMVSGNVLDLLAGIDAVADDLTFYGSLGSPTFRVAELTVA